MSNFWARTITGLSMVFILLIALVFSGWVFASIFLVIAILGLWEFYGLIASDSCHPQKFYGTISGAILYMVFTYFLSTGNVYEEKYWSPLFLTPFLLIIPFIVLSFIFEIYRKRPNPLINISTTILGVLYIALPLALLNAFSGNENPKFYGLPEVLMASSLGNISFLKGSPRKRAGKVL
jgi:phosphatidate cytidylyltransferase